MTAFLDLGAKGAPADWWYATLPCCMVQTDMYVLQKS